MQVSTPDMKTGNHFIYNIVDNIFQQCHYTESDSQCSCHCNSCATESLVDKRLQYWKDMIRKRRILQRKMCLTTSRKPEQLLFNMQQIELDDCPENCKLKVIGRNIWIRQPCEQISGHTITDSTPIELSEPIGATSIMCGDTCVKCRAFVAAASQLALLINGTTYRRYRPEFSPILERRFVCNPYERCLRTIMRIENNGREIINFKWCSADFFAYNNTLFNQERDAFVFDAKPFQLAPGGVREVSVLFCPRKIGIVKQRWYLYTKPRIFYRCPCALTLNMHGRCTPPLEYLRLLQQNMDQTMRYRRQKPSLGMRQITPFKSPRTLCPFVRELDDSEIFNLRNFGFHCKRSSDIEGLKRFFERGCANSICDLKWDYCVRTLIELVCSTADRLQRIELFEELQLLLSQLRGRTASIIPSEASAKSKQQQRTKFIYVRGLISSGIELWEQKIWLLAEQVLKSLVNTISDNSQAQEMLKQSKYFRDSIYMYTYDQLCDIAENIVSVIESSEHA
ncbi:GH21522 [Drosophila grimshawi]|uniref:GH21522 n=1 Tax=Drosophila grimshawi TaxID=7222 RepID=B4J403_DROGR|nr:GH21522 [Drosophila grimshawi]